MTKISWTHTTWNPLAGCTRASRGCDFCYAAKMSLRLEAMAKAKIEKGESPGAMEKYIGVSTKNKAGIPVFNGKINLDYEKLDEPLSWRKSRMVFVNSMSDLFHKDVPFAFIARVFDVMRNTPQHTYQVLTKRPENASAFSVDIQLHISGWEWPENVWLGTSVEDQDAANERIPALLRVDGPRIRFLSMEPLLGAVKLTIHDDFSDRGHGRGWLNSTERNNINWVIVGGESGTNARPMHTDWARSIRDQCVDANVPFFFKQNGEFLLIDDAIALGLVNTYTDSHKTKNSDGVYYARVGKKDAGSLLDGKEWKQFPEVADALS